MFDMFVSGIEIVWFGSLVVIFVGGVIGEMVVQEVDVVIGVVLLWVV